jgi:hypothetical protein
MKTTAFTLPATVVLIAGLARAASAQPSQQPPPAQVETSQPGQAPRVVVQDDNASETRGRLHEILRQHPPSLTSVLRLDPTLLTTPSYLAPYPALAAFLAQHPEIARSPAYYLGQGNDSRDETPERYRTRMAGQVLDSFMIFSGLMTLLGVFAWLIKAAFDHRRFLRQSRMQAEAQNKVFDRLTSNEDLLAYIQTPPGRRFLEAAPLPLEGALAPAGAPVTKILWSVQAGAVATMVGLGFLFVSTRFAADTTGFAETSPALFLMGCVISAAGLGFVLSAVAAYLLSRRLGLLPAPESSHA